MPDDLEQLTVADADAWWAWLLTHHAERPGTWLVLAKKGTTAPTNLTYPDALDAALAHGWIDGQVRRHDASTYLQRFTPRTRRSLWSRINVGHVERLLAEGRMHPAGVAEAERAREDGRWAAAYPGPATAEVPDDLAAALAVDPAATAMFEVLTSQNRYAILHRIGQAVRPDTRARRISDLVAMLARGETIHPQRRRPCADD